MRTKTGTNLLLKSDTAVASSHSDALKAMSEQLASISVVEVTGTNQAVKDLCNQQYDTMNSLLQSYNLMTIRDADRIVEIAKNLEDTDAEMKSDMLGYIMGGIG